MSEVEAEGRTRSRIPWAVVVLLALLALPWVAWGPIDVVRCVLATRNGILLEYPRRSLPLAEYRAAISAEAPCVHVVATPVDDDAWWVTDPIGTSTMVLWGNRTIPVRVQPEPPAGDAPFERRRWDSNPRTREAGHEFSRLAP